MLSIVQTTQPEMITIRYATFDFRRYFGNNRDRGDDRSSAVRPVRPGNLGRIHAADLSSLSSPRATILIASSGNGRCSALASSHGARIQTSRSSSVSRMTGMAFGMDRFDDRVRRRREKAVDVMRAGDRFRFRPAVAFELGPDAGEAGQRPIVS